MFEKGIEDRPPVAVRQVAKDFREVGGMLFLKQVEQVGSRTDPLQSLD